MRGRNRKELNLGKGIVADLLWGFQLKEIWENKDELYKNNTKALDSRGTCVAGRCRRSASTKSEPECCSACEFSKYDWVQHEHDDTWRVPAIHKALSRPIPGAVRRYRHGHNGAPRKSRDSAVDPGWSQWIGAVCSLAAGPPE